MVCLLLVFQCEFFFSEQLDRSTAEGVDAVARIQQLELQIGLVSSEQLNAKYIFGECCSLSKGRTLYLHPVSTFDMVLLLVICLYLRRLTSLYCRLIEYQPC